MTQQIPWTFAIVFVAQFVVLMRIGLWAPLLSESIISVHSGHGLHLQAALVAFLSEVLVGIRARRQTTEDESFLQGL